MRRFAKCKTNRDSEALGVERGFQLRYSIFDRSQALVVATERCCSA